jgi:hypothetical protein
MGWKVWDFNYDELSAAEKKTNVGFVSSLNTDPMALDKN